MLNTGDDRRGDPRFLTQLGALVVPSDGEPRRGRVDNVSVSGLWVDTPDPPAQGTLCTVAIELADERWPIRSVAGRVVRRERNGFAVACFADQRAVSAELVLRVRQAQASAALEPERAA